MAWQLETGGEAYAPLAYAILRGLLSSCILTVCVDPGRVEHNRLTTVNRSPNLELRFVGRTLACTGASTNTKFPILQRL